MAFQKAIINNFGEIYEVTWRDGEKNEVTYGNLRKISMVTSFLQLFGITLTKKFHRMNAVPLFALKQCKYEKNVTKIEITLTFL